MREWQRALAELLQEQVELLHGAVEPAEEQGSERHEQMVDAGAPAGEQAQFSQDPDEVFADPCKGGKGCVSVHGYIIVGLLSD